MRGILVAKKIQRLSQRRTPLLIPSRFTSGVTTTIANPTPHPVRTTPRCALAAGPVVDFNLKCRWMLIEIFSVIGNPEPAPRRLYFQRVRQTNLAELEMMAVGFAVSRDVQHLFTARHLRKSINETAARLQKVFKSDCPRCRPFIKENRDRSVRAVTMSITIGNAGIDAVLVDDPPICTIYPVATAPGSVNRSQTRDLMRRQDYASHVFFDYC